MKNNPLRILFCTAFALLPMWLHQCVQAGAATTLKDCFEFGINWLDWNGIEAIAAFIAVTVIGFFLFELLPRPSRLIAAVLLPVASIYVMGR